MKIQRLRLLLKAAAKLLGSPTGKQKEAYGRLAHTLCAAAWVAAMSIMFSRSPSWGSWYDAAQAGSLVLVGAGLFVLGAILSKGE